MKIRNMTRCALMAAVMAVCAWIAIPVGSLAVSLQIFGLFLALGLLGGRLGTATVAVYLGLGALGLPVFTGFQGGFSALTGPTAGYLWGFLLASVLWWLCRNHLPRPLIMTLGLLICYLCGTVWFAWLTGTGFWVALWICVIPYLLFDIVKLILADFITSKLKKSGIWRDNSWN